MNETERKALRMYVSGAIADYGCKVYGDDDECMRVEEDEEEMIRIQRADSIVSYIERLLSAADAPGVTCECGEKPHESNGL